MRVGEYLAFVARLRGVPGPLVSRRVADVLELTATGRERNKLISALSHGYRQRVGIAQAIVHRPGLVVLDEPISGLDPKQIVDMRKLVRSLRGEHTVIISSHILTEISETCDRILVIRDGEIAAEGDEAELFAQMREGSRRVDVTVRKPGCTRGEAFAELERAAKAVPGVTGVEEQNPTEAGEGLASARVLARDDVRDALCRALVKADLGVLGLARSEHELENVFLELSGAEPQPSVASTASSSNASASAKSGAAQEESA
jgi:ABC-2 type transport system ATP-binding protein